MILLHDITWHQIANMMRQIIMELAKEIFSYEANSSDVIFRAFLVSCHTMLLVWLVIPTNSGYWKILWSKSREIIVVADPLSLLQEMTDILYKKVIDALRHNMHKNIVYSFKLEQIIQMFYLLCIWPKLIGMQPTRINYKVCPSNNWQKYCTAE